MKNKIYFLILMLLMSCQSNDSEQKQIFDFINIDNKSGESTREFQLKTDSTIRRIFLKQNAKQINDNVWEYEFYWFNKDSVPISKSIERYSTDNTIELIEQSIYELDTIKRYIELKAEIIGQKSFSANNFNGSIDVKYQFQNDKNLIMKIHTDFTHEFKSIDTLGKKGLNYLVMSSKEKISIEHSDNRRDTAIYTKNTRIYEKGKGLIFFGQNSNGKTYWFRLKE